MADAWKAALVCLLALAVQAMADPPSPYQPPAEPDSALQALLVEAFAHNPGLQGGAAAVAAARERIPQAGALADPVLSLGLQNDGFDGLQIGKMETSYYQVMASQALPWPGKRGLREGLARLEADAPAWTLQRQRRTLRADVVRAYAALQLARGQHQLLDEEEGLLDQAIQAARVRVETGQASALELMRAAQQRSRLELDRLGIRSRERAARAALNRLRGARDDARLPEATPLAITLVHELSFDSLVAVAEAGSPELSARELDRQIAEERVLLSRRERMPDLGLNAGVMPRGGLDPMWQAGVSCALPLWSGRKQGRVVAEAEHLLERARLDEQATRDELWRVTRERLAWLDGELETLRLYRDQLLPQDEDLLRATLDEYVTGRGAFSGVLAAVAARQADRAAHLEGQVRILALLAAIEEINLSGTPPVLSGGLATAGVAAEGGSGTMEETRPESGGGTSPGKPAGGSSMNNM